MLQGEVFPRKPRSSAWKESPGRPEPAAPVMQQEDLAGGLGGGTADSLLPSAESRQQASETPELYSGLQVLQKSLSLTPRETRTPISSVSPPDPSSFPTYYYPVPRALSFFPFSPSESLSVLPLDAFGGAHSAFPYFQPSSQILSNLRQRFPPFPRLNF